MKRIATFLLLALLIPTAVGAISLPNPLCQNQANPCVPSPTCSCGFPDLIEKIVNYISLVVTNITNYVFGVIGALAILMFVWSGILFVISAGSEEKIGKAKKTAIYAAIGAAIAIAGAGLVATIRQVLQG